ncbi:MAG: rod shape-determining protein [Candidatus Colwellbacteria bacterium]|nr:rod shape-determining protein [Candidatus Colwellbacteria bacterium]MBI3274190.1 rod shape-determining protein [Candidatus Colwellbacteria bacterium]
MGILERFYKNIGIDLGTANFLLYLKGQGIVVNEPTLVAVNTRTGQILAVGVGAKKMLDRTPAHINLIKPLMAGVISDFETTEEIIKYFLRKVSEDSFISRYKLAAVSVPTNLTEVERKSVEDAVMSAGVSRALLVEEPIASAIGARLPVEEAIANMIVDVGGGTTEISIISVGGTVVSKSLKIAGQRFNEDIMRFVKDEFKLIIGEPTAEELKINIGSATSLDEKMEMAARGRDIGTGLPKEILVRGTHVRAAMSKSLKLLVEEIKILIEEAPPELVGDILRRGIHLSGGGSLLKALDRYIEKEISVQTEVVDDPLTCVVRGLGIIIEDLDKYEPILSNQQKPKIINP